MVPAHAKVIRTDQDDVRVKQVQTKHVQQKRKKNEILIRRDHAYTCILFPKYILILIIFLFNTHYLFVRYRSIKSKKDKRNKNIEIQIVVLPCLYVYHRQKVVNDIQGLITNRFL